jgi:hypothetical protein
VTVIFRQPKDIIAVIQQAFDIAFSKPHKMVQMVMLDDHRCTQSCSLGRDEEGNTVFATRVETPSGVYSLEYPLNGKHPVKLHSSQVVGGIRHEKTYELPLEEFISKHYQWPFAMLKEQLDKVLSHTKLSSEPTSEQSAEKPALESADGQVAEVQNTPWQVIRIARDDQPTLRFEGVERARTSTALRNGRGFVLRAFETKSGKWVAHKEGVSLWPGERVRSESKVLERVEQLPEFFGYGPAAKELYRQLGMTERFEEVID